MPEIFDASRNKKQSSHNQPTPAPDPTHSHPHHVNPSRMKRKRDQYYGEPAHDSQAVESEIEVAPQHYTSTGEHQVESHHAARHVDEYSSVMRHESPSGMPFSAYAAKPTNTALDIQESSETIILLLRQHPITQLRWIIIAILLSLLPLLFSSISFFGFLPANFQLAGLIGWYLLVTGFVLEAFISWFFNVYIITDERIIDVDFYSLIFKNISAAKIDNIEDTSATTGGFWASLFDYGTVTIQTAAEKREFEFDSVPHPNRVTKLINEMILEEEREKIEGRVR